MFPNVIVHRRIDTIKNNSKFEKAKNGDIDAAIKLIYETINISKIIDIKRKYPNSFIVPIISIDNNKMNKLPIAYAEVISLITSFRVKNIYQINDVGRTNKNAIERLINRPKYSGDVEKDKNYIIIDDVITQGGTINELKKYIESKKGNVVACSTIAYTQYSTILEITNETIKKIERKFGRDETEKYLKEYKIGERIEDLSNSEGRYIYKFKNIEQLRNKTLETINRRIPKENKKSIKSRIEASKKIANNIVKNPINKDLEI